MTSHRDVIDTIVDKDQLDRDLVAAERIDPIGGGVGHGQGLAIAGVPIVIEDDLAVKIFEGHFKS
jgi:hypothetical protein